LKFFEVCARQIKESDVILLALGRFEAPYLKIP
jgi:hypothetical protein